MAYSKQTWDTTSYVNPTRMNHIEQGIYDGSVKADKTDSIGVSVTAAQSDVTISVNKSVRIGNMLFLNVKGTSTNAHAQQVLFQINGAGSSFSCADFTFGVPKGGEWGVTGITYGYVASNGGVIINNSAGDYFHINIAVPITLL